MKACPGVWGGRDFSPCCEEYTDYRKKKPWAVEVEMQLALYAIEGGMGVKERVGQPRYSWAGPRKTYSAMKAYLYSSISGLSGSTTGTSLTKGVDRKMLMF